MKGINIMSTPSKNIKYYTYTGRQITPLEQSFINHYLKTKNATQAVIEAGYKSKTPAAQGRALLDRDYIRGEIQHQLDEQKSRSIADSTEILQFYTSVMRGEVLDQFGIEASLDTRIRAANELARQQIEIPLKLEQKNIQNNIGSIQINFTPRNTEDKDSE